MYCFMRFYYVIPFLFLANFAVGQTNHFCISQIDSLALTIDTAKDVTTAITDGTMKPKGKRKPHGSFSDTYYLKSTTNKLTKVEHGESFFTQNLTTYYFYDNSLILVKTTERNLKDDEEILKGRYYFANGVLFERQEMGNPLTRPEAYLQHAGLYLKNIKGVFNLK